MSELLSYDFVLPLGLRLCYLGHGCSVLSVFGDWRLPVSGVLA